MNKRRTMRTRMTMLVVTTIGVSFMGFLGASNHATAQTSIVRATEVQLAPGERSVHPAVAAGPDLTFIGTSDAPLASSLDAQNAIADRGIYWALGGRFLGNAGPPVTIFATHGNATVGHAGDTSKLRTPDGQGPVGACVGWIGLCNIPVFTCTRGGDCIDSGALIPRIENRPVWIVDIGGATFVGSRVAYNHSVYAVDEATKTVLFVWGYNGP